MLPPDMIAPTFFPLNLLSFITAAITKAPDISTTIFILYMNNFEAFINSYSVIKITYYTFPFRTSKFISPKLTLTPSANVLGGN